MLRQAWPLLSSSCNARMAGPVGQSCQGGDAREGWPCWGGMVWQLRSCVREVTLGRDGRLGEGWCSCMHKHMNPFAYLIKIVFFLLPSSVFLL